eukprot:PITA_09235
MGRTPCCDMMGVRKGPWSSEEDRKLIDYIQKHGFGNWRALPKQAGVMRCGKSCRLRWMNYLRPDIKRGSLSAEEEQTIIQLHGILGNKWSTIASYLPGRTDNEIKNLWNTHLKKRFAQRKSRKNLLRDRAAHSRYFSTTPTTPGAVNNTLSSSPAMHNSREDHDFQLLSSYSPYDYARMDRIENNYDVNDFIQACEPGPFVHAHEQLLHCIPGSPIFSTLKHSESQMVPSGAECSVRKDISDDQQFAGNTFSETCSTDGCQTDENRSAQDYINFLKKFLDIDDESSVISAYELHEKPDATFTIESHHFYNEESTLERDNCLSLEQRVEDHINPGLSCWYSPISANQFDHEIQTSLAGSQVSYFYSPNSSSSNSLNVSTPMSLSLDFLLEFPGKLWQAF